MIHSASPDYYLYDSDLSSEIYDSIYLSLAWRVMFFVLLSSYCFCSVHASFSIQSYVIYLHRQVLTYLNVLGLFVNKHTKTNTG